MSGDLPNEAEESDNESMEEHDFDCEDEEMSTYEPSDHSDTESDVESGTEEASRFLATDGNLRTEPKFISFLVQILLLFNFCHFCKSDNPNIKATKCGTMLIVRSHCINPACLNKNLWRSQPKKTGTNIPAGNFLLCMSTLLAGGSISKVRQIFNHMNLFTISFTTFFKHQREKLFPAIYIHWKVYQAGLLRALKDESNPAVLAGDARHDSMGHSAKYGTYLVYSCSHLVQVTI
ncbi:uncharacterized protein LOC135687139 [Rhopilema esculentum]|uniref:uncharacterized protein LOC135687139 n=1 Tax=Rhopilema esculentum TaxID=499914 RepID=UPI0031D50AD0